MKIQSTRFPHRRGDNIVCRHFRFCHRLQKLATLLALGAALIEAPVRAQKAEPETDQARLNRLKDLRLEDLLHAEVATASKRPEKLWESSAAAFLIQNEDIRRSGARSIADALRLAPGVNVASLNANKTVVSIRGFSDLYTDKLLVLVDGRSVYSPITSGVFWEALDYPLEDIERIEVIRGPGGTLWGANAVNGVINIITKSAKDTPGAWLSGGYGSEARGFGEARYGGSISQNTTYRAYLKYRNEDAFADGNDAWRFWQAGYRVDWEKEANSISLHGDVHRGDYNQVVLVPGYSPPYLNSRAEKFHDLGGNLQATFLHRFSDESELQLQAYYDGQRRNELVLQSEQDIFDVDLQHRFPLPGRQSFMYGLGYRYLPDHFDNANPFYFYLPDTRHTQLFSGFVQDEITLVENQLKLTLGTKVEHNDYTGWEVQPSARLGWTPTQRQTLWASVSRAVQVPGRNINDIHTTLVPLPPVSVVNGLPLFIRGNGSPDIQPQELIGYELGYRVQPADALSFDLALFYNNYDKFISGSNGTPFFEAEPTPHLILPVTATSLGNGRSYGAELAINWRVLDSWRLAGTYSFLKLDLQNATGVNGLFEEGKNPRHQASLRSSMDLPHNLSLDVWGRFVDQLPTLNVNAYFDLDVRLAWQPRPQFELAVVGQNLVQPRRFEFARTLIGVNTAAAVERGIYVQASLRF